MRGAPSGRFIYKGVAWGIFASPLANCLVLPPWLIRLSTLPEVHTEPQPDGLQPEGVWGGGEWQDYSLAFPASRPRGAFLPVSRLSLAPGRGMCDLLIHLAPLCSCHDCYGKVSAGDKAWRFTPRLLLFLF